MTDSTQPAEAPEPLPVLDDPAPPEPSAPPADPEGSSEAAKYRRRLRETEGQRDTYRDRLEVLERAELARIATATDHDGPRLHDAADVFGADADLDAFRDDDGHIDPDKVREAIREATEGRVHLRADVGPRPPRPNPAQGAQPGTGRRETSAGEGWSEALARR